MKVVMVLIKNLLGIIKYMKEQSKPAYTELKSVKEAQKFMSQEDVTIVGFFDKQSDEKLLDSFKEACKNV